MKKRKRGFATYVSWTFKILAGVFAIVATFALPERSGADIVLISAAIFAPFLPIDVSKIRQSVEDNKCR